jgi:short-subunit dehydrogenase
LINVSTGLTHFISPDSQRYSTSKTAALNIFEFIQNQNNSLHVVSISPGSIVTDMSIKSGFPAQDDGESLILHASLNSMPLKQKIWLHTFKFGLQALTPTS